MKRLDLVIGPNGAGKSTFVELTLAPLLPTSPFVNADLIARHRWPADVEARSYEAARIADATRRHLIDTGRSFIAETVFSHESKLELIDMAQDVGFVVIVHVLMVPEEISVRRVAHRVAAGGHSVPENKIRTRFHRMWPLAAQAVRRADEAIVYDTASGVAPAIVAEYAHGTPIGATSWPEWTPPALRGMK